MVTKNAIMDLDQQLWSEYVVLRNQAEVAARHGLTQQAVSLAISRYLATIPEPERRQHRERMLSRLEDLYQAHYQAARERPRTAAVVRQIIMDEARLLGLVESKVQHQGQVDLAHTWQPGPSLADVLDDLRERGVLKGEITRREP